MNWTECTDWELDRLLSDCEFNIDMKTATLKMYQRSGNETGLIAKLKSELDGLKSIKGQVRAEIAKRHPNGFPPVLIG